MNSPAQAALTITNVSKALGGRTIIRDISLTVRSGELMCLLGPSGCGKTTMLRIIGGFLMADAGSVVIGDRDVSRLPPERRPTAMVFQNYALWPHMTVFQNVAYGLRVRKLGKAEIRERVERVLKLVNLTHHMDNRPSRISGGEQQRVALARALVLEPEVLLLDEPLSNLDAKLRVKVRDDIREIQQRVGITTVLVTHDQDEALSVSDHIAVMNGGDVEQFADARSLYQEPATRFVAGFVGSMNLFEAWVVPGAIRIQPNDVEVPCVRPPTATEGSWEVGVRPEDVLVGPPGDGAPGRIVREMPRGHFKELALTVAGQEVRAYVPSNYDAERNVGVRFERVLLYRDGALFRGEKQLSNVGRR